MALRGHSSSLPEEDDLVTFWKSTLQTDHKNSRLGVVWRRKGNVRKASAALYSQNDHFCIAPFRTLAVYGDYDPRIPEQKVNSVPVVRLQERSRWLLNRKSQNPLPTLRDLGSWTPNYWSTPACLLLPSTPLPPSPTWKTPKGKDQGTGLKPSRSHPGNWEKGGLREGTEGGRGREGGGNGHGGDCGGRARGIRTANSPIGYRCSFSSTGAESPAQRQTPLSRPTRNERASERALTQRHRPLPAAWQEPPQFRFPDPALCSGGCCWDLAARIPRPATCPPIWTETGITEDGGESPEGQKRSRTGVLPGRVGKTKLRRRLPGSGEGAAPPVCARPPARPPALSAGRVVSESSRGAGQRQRSWTARRVPQAASALGLSAPAEEKEQRYPMAPHLAYSSCASRLTSVLRTPSVYGLAASPRITTHAWRNGLAGDGKDRRHPPWRNDSILGAVVGLGVAAVGIPAAIGVLGFGSGGIVAGSIGTKMMSAAAIANGGGVAAGGVVATLQSIGAAGVPTAVSAAATAGGAVLGALKGLCS
ncbi:uncharacterized protein PHA67_002683 [Liasis olivaceus]